MSVLILQKGEREAAWDKIRMHDSARASWIDDPEREAAMQKYPGEYIAELKGNVIEHFEKMDDLFSALRKRISDGENTIEIITDHLIPKPVSREDVFKNICADLDMHGRDPTKQLIYDLYQRAYSSMTEEELHRQFTI